MGRPSQTRNCPSCGELRSGRSFKGHPEQCTGCRRDPDLATQPAQCNRCTKPFSKDQWFHEKTGRGWLSECRACHAQHQKDYTADIENKPPRTCKACGETKAAAAFQGPRNTCRPCKAQQDRQKAACVPKAGPAALPKPAACAACGKDMGDADLTLRTDTHLGTYRPECRACRATAKDGTNYSQVCRKRQRERSDFPAIKRRNNAINAAWHASNPGKSSEYQAKYRADAGCKMRQIMQSAKQRGIEVVQEDVPAMEASLLDPCFYCGHLPGEGEPLNGLDRTESQHGYSLSNTVPCCAACNHIKGPYHPTFFLEHVRRVAGFHPPDCDVPTAEVNLAYRERCSHNRPKADKTDYLDRDERFQLLPLWASTV